MSFLALKIITSSIVIILITEIAKRHTLLGGLIAAMPVNILLSLFWIHLENKDTQIINSFVQSVLWGIVPTVIFLLSILYLLKKQYEFLPSILTGLIILAICALFHQKLLS